VTGAVLLDLLDRLGIRSDRGQLVDDLAPPLTDHHEGAARAERLDR
jgi:hypothetical protein